MFHKSIFIMKNSPSIPTFLINATYRIHPEDISAYSALAARMVKAAARREGCSFISAAQDVLDVATFHLLEGWESRDNFDSHIASSDFQGILKEAMKLRIIDRFGDIVFVSSVEKLDMPT